MKIGDIISAYHKGYHKITKISKRWNALSNSMYTIYDEYNSETCGEQINDLIYYITLFDSNGKPIKSDKEKCCDSAFCKMADETISNEISNHLEKIENLRNLLSNITNSEREIILNQIKTPDGTIIKSMHVHDYVTYLDKNGKTYMVDGGNEYLRRNIHKDAPYTELTIYSNDKFEIIRENYHRGGRGKDGDQPLTWVPISKMNDQWLDAAIQYNEERSLGESFANKMYKKEKEYRKQNNIVIPE
jgi:hypothetical protein